MRPTVDDLLALSRNGRHAASDHLETAALAGLPTIGCRRCGGGLAGAVGVSNVLAGVRLAEELGPDLIVLDGSGAAIPPVAADRRILVVGAHQDAAVSTGYLNPYRALLADLVVVAMAEDGVEHACARPGARRADATGRARRAGGAAAAPARRRAGPRVAFFGTAPATQHDRIARHLEEAYGAEVTHVSGSLSDRAALRAELAQPRRRRRRRRDQGGRDRRRRRGGRARSGSRSSWPGTTSCRSPASRTSMRARAARGRGDRALGRERMSERRYLAPLPLGGHEGPPWSKGLMARALAATGLTPTRAYELARRADADMIARRALELDLDRLARARERGPRRARGGADDAPPAPAAGAAAPRAPVLLLVGGATGTGKSTLATETAHRLGITRVTSTDFIRQTMRAFFSREFMPSVHYSSFEAELGLSHADEDVAGDAALLGFLDQTRNVLVGVEAAIDRSLTEGWSMVLEGVHLVPGMISVDRSDALVVQCVVAISDEDAHRSHFWVRDSATDGLRPLEKYLEGMTEIRMIQDVLLERARRFDVPVIENTSLDEAIGQMLDLVLTGAERLARV